MLRQATAVLILFCLTASEADARRRYYKHRSYHKERSEPKKEVKKEEPPKPTPVLSYLDSTKCHAAMPYVFTLGDEPVFMPQFDTSIQVQRMQRFLYFQRE